MQKKTFAIAMISVMVIVICLFINYAAAGLIHHKVTVTNTTDKPVAIATASFDGHQYEAMINANSEHVFDFKLKCPSVISGIVHLGYGKFKQLPLTCISEGQGSSGAGSCPLSCKSSHFKIIMYNTVDGIGYFLRKE